MLKLFNLMVIFLLLTSCSKDETSTAILNDPGTTTGKVLAQGSLSGTPGHSVSGTAKLIEENGVKIVRLENFFSTNGPDLKVYLAKDANASVFINLGNLKSVSGNQNYAITGMVSATEYKYILIWCQQFGVLFGSAQIN
jgi:hypothetical protein